MIPRERHQALYDAYVLELAARFPGFRLVRKGESRLQAAIGRLLRILTFGGQSAYVDRFVTTLGRAVYVPDDWQERVPPGDRYCTLRHEAVHLEQFRRLGFPLMALVYVLLPIPVGFAAGRALLEWHGYRETLRATWEVFGPERARDPALHDAIVRRFTGPDYGWMWLSGRTVRAAIGRTLTRLEAETPPK